MGRPAMILGWTAFAEVDLVLVLLIWSLDGGAMDGLAFGRAGSAILVCSAMIIVAGQAMAGIFARSFERLRGVLYGLNVMVVVMLAFLAFSGALAHWRGAWILIAFGAAAMYAIAYVVRRANGAHDRKREASND